MIENASVETIRGWKQIGCWYRSPDGDFVSLGKGVSLGDFKSEPFRPCSSPRKYSARDRANGE